MRPAAVAGLVPILLAALALAPAPQGGSASHPPRFTTRNGGSAPRQHAVRVLLLHDMEGVSGIDNSRMLGAEYPEPFAKGRKSLIADVNAVVAGLFDGGATAVDIKNSHGGCDDLSCVPPEQLDGRAKILVAEGPLDPYSQLAERGAWDAVVAVGMHDKPLSGGFAPHTLGAGLSPVINGHTLTETELVGYSFGSVGIPVIFVSGDDHLQRDLAESMPWIEFVVVKRATGSNNAELLPPDDVHAQMRAAAKRAVQALGRMHPMELTPPVVAGLLATFPASLPPRLPGVTHRGDTVTFSAGDYREAYNGIRGLVAVASTFATRRPFDYVARRPEFQEAMKQAWDSVDTQWLAYEDGRFKPPTRPTPPLVGKYHRVP